MSGTTPALVWARRSWPVVKWLIGLGLATAALWALTGRRGELSGASTYLAQLQWPWLIPATVLEIGSLLCFAAMTRVLLRSAHVEVGLGPLAAITLVATTITNSVPGGAVVSTVFTYRQFRRRGADEAVTAWVLVAMFIAASVSLALLAAGGVAAAASAGSTLDLIVPIVGVLAVTVALGVVFVQRRLLSWAVSGVVRGFRRITGLPRGDLGRQTDRVVARLTTVRLRPRQGLVAAAWGLGNWTLDCACLAIAFPALGVGIPWKGLLLAYGAGQLAANLPVTPGGLGVVEGSLTIALVAFGGGRVSTVAAVLLYRILSFWVELPLGWVTWAVLAWRAREAPGMAPLALAAGADVRSGETVRT